MPEFQIIGLKDFQKAINRHPTEFLKQARILLVRGMAVYKRGINRSPWRVGGAGGGAPVKSGNLRDTHHSKVNKLSASIFPTANYAKYVHGRKRNEFNARTGVQARPWLDFVKKDKDPEIRILQRNFLNKIVKNLAK